METDNKKTDIFKVALQISDLVKSQKPPTFSELVKILDGRVSRNEISVAIDRLMDVGLLEQKGVIKNWNFRWELYLTREADPLIEKIMKVASK